LAFGHAGKAGTGRIAIITGIFCRSRVILPLERQLTFSNQLPPLNV
jgi:hypothetical protein